MLFSLMVQRLYEAMICKAVFRKNLPAVPMGKTREKTKYLYHRSGNGVGRIRSVRFKSKTLNSKGQKVSHKFSKYYAYDERGRLESERFRILGVCAEVIE